MSRTTSFVSRLGQVGDQAVLFNYNVETEITALAMPSTWIEKLA